MTTRLQTPFEICKLSSDFANPHPKNANPKIKNANLRTAICNDTIISVKTQRKTAGLIQIILVNLC